MVATTISMMPEDLDKEVTPQDLADLLGFLRQTLGPASPTTVVLFDDDPGFVDLLTEGAGTARRIQMGRTTIIETITDWESGAMFSYAISGLPPVIGSVTNTWLIGASGNSTMVSLTTEIDAGARPPRRLVAGVVGRRLGRSSDAMLAGLSTHLASNKAP